MDVDILGMADFNEEVSRIQREGTILKEWVIKEYTQHVRGQAWFVVSGLVALVLIVLSLWTPNFIFERPNFLFAEIIVLAAVVVMLWHHREPPNLAVVLFEDGVAIGETFFPYRELGQFWIIYEPPHVKTLYFHFRSTIRPRLPIPLEDENPLDIRQILLQYLPEDLERESEPTSDALSRILRL